MFTDLPGDLNRGRYVMGDGDFAYGQFLSDILCLNKKIVVFCNLRVVKRLKLEIVNVFICILPNVFYFLKAIELWGNT